MNIAVGMALFLCALAVLFGIVPVLQWRGKLPPGNPNLISQRFYLVLPYSGGLLVWAVAILLGGVVSRGIAVTLFAVGLLLMLAGGVLWIWGPQRLRPRWQKEYMAEMGYDRPASSRRSTRRRSRGRS